MMLATFVDGIQVANNKTWAYLISKLLRQFGADKYIDQYLSDAIDWMDQYLTYLLWGLLGLTVVAFMLWLAMFMKMNTPKAWNSVLRNKSFIAILVFGTIITSILLYSSKDRTDEYLYEKYRSSVVLIITRHCYKVTLPLVRGEQERKVIFFSLKNGGKKAQNILIKELESPDTSIWVESYGTGFFFDDNGNIMTNRHVVDYHIELDDKEKEVLFINLKNFTGATLCNHYLNQVEKLNNQIAKQREIIDNPNLTDSNSPYYNPQMHEDALEKWYNLNREQEVFQKRLNEFIQMDWNTLLVEDYYNYSFLYAGSNIKNENCCELVSWSEKSDLAILTISDKTPNGIHPIEIDRTGKVSYKVGQIVHYIGYSRGISEISTPDSIANPQNPSGKIMQLSKDRMMYDLSLLQGTSGGPVINSNGELVAVNCGGFDGIGFDSERIDQNYNYGVPLDCVRQYVEGGLVFGSRDGLDKLIKNKGVIKKGSLLDKARKR